MPADDIAPPEAGPLRAGSVDDNADFAGYLEYLERIQSFGIPCANSTRPGGSS